MLGTSARQPQTPVGIDWSNSLTRGLSFVSPGNTIPRSTVVGAKLKPSSKGLFRGFGATFGTGATDSIVVPFNAHATVRTYFARIYANGVGGGALGRVFEKRVAGVVTESLNLVASGPAIQYSRGWSTAAGGIGTWNSPAASISLGSWIDVVCIYDSSSTANAPVFYINGGLVSTATVSAPAGALVNNTDNYVIGNRKNDSLRGFDGLIGPVMFFDRALSYAEVKSLTNNPYQVFLPVRQPVFIATAVVSIFRPSNDVTTAGWTGTPDNTTLFNNIDESAPSDTDYITSPNISGGENCIFAIMPSLAAGTWDVRYRANFVGSSAQVRITLLDDSNVSQGVSSWQTVTDTFALYTASVTTTGTAARVKIEVQ